jgi:hypothetical protein
MGQQRIIVGANVICYLNGKPLGFVSSFHYNASTPSRKIGGIDSPEVLELAPTSSMCSFNMTVFRVKGGGGIQGIGMGPISIEVPRGKYFTFLLLDRITDTIIWQGKGCRVENEGGSFEAKAMSMVNVAGSCLTWDNEVRPMKV